MKGRASTIFGIAIAAALLAAAALGAWAFATRRADRPEALTRPGGEAARRQAEALRSIGAEVAAAEGRAVAAVPLPGRLDGGAGPAGMAERSAGSGAGQGPGDTPRPQEQEAERLTSGMAKLVRDLEYNADAGLPEPPQQTIAPAPAPWRPEPGVEEQQGPVIDAVSPRGAPAAGGAQVTIRGRNLRPSQVMFGTAPARVVRVTGEEVVVVAPRGAPGPVTVAVTNDDGTFALAREPFTYGR